MKIFYLFLLPLSLLAYTSSSLYKSLDPNSLSHQLIFYELYPKTSEGKKAYQRVCSLLSIPIDKSFSYDFLANTNIQGIINLVNNQVFSQSNDLSQKELQIISSISSHFANRRLKGYYLWEEKSLKSLDSDQIDIARAILLPQLKNKNKILSYEANLDLMTLQILAQLGKNPTNEEKVHAINKFIFFDMHFRFPPHSIHSKEIDYFTLLPSVMDSRRGVCLGVSLLYLCLAQRLDLPLEAVTPPGHIFLRYKKNDGSLINIETTARGIHLPNQAYLGIETRSLQTRELKEVVGLMYMNQAAIYLEKEDFSTAQSLYEKAQDYISNDVHLLELLAYAYLLNNKEKQAIDIFLKIKDIVPDYSVRQNTVIEDFLNKKTDKQAIFSIYTSTDETQKSITKKRQLLEKILEKYPSFRAGLLQLASSWLQIGRLQEAQHVLEKYILLSQDDPLVNYYLAIIYMERYDFNKSWERLIKTKTYLSRYHHHPKALIELEQSLRKLCPPPTLKHTRATHIERKINKVKS